MYFMRDDGWIFHFICNVNFSLFRCPSPSCPADRQPLSREKVVHLAALVTRSRNHS